MDKIITDNIKLFLQILGRIFIPSMPVVMFMLLLHNHEVIPSLFIIAYAALFPIAYLLQTFIHVQIWDLALQSCIIVLTTVMVLFLSKIEHEKKLRIASILGILNALSLIILFIINEA